MAKHHQRKCDSLVDGKKGERNGEGHIKLNEDANATMDRPMPSIISDFLSQREFEPNQQIF